MTETYEEFLERKVNNLRKKAKERFARDIVIEVTNRITGEYSAFSKNIDLIIEENRTRFRNKNHE